MRHSLVRALVLHYLEKFGYKGPPVRIFTRPSSLIRALERKRDLTTFEERVAKRYHGAFYLYGRSAIVYVHAEIHDSLGELMDTCAHEALHAARYPASHPPQFDAEIAEAVLG